MIIALLIVASVVAAEPELIPFDGTLVSTALDSHTITIKESSGIITRRIPSDSNVVRINDCPDQAIANIPAGSHVVGQRDKTTGAVYWWKVTAKRNRRVELLRGEDVCIAGSVSKLDLKKRVITIVGPTGDQYTARAPEGLVVKRYGDLETRDRLEGIRIGEKISMVFRPTSSVDSSIVERWEWYTLR